ncbi:MAG TPA: M20/M25/M40 family metallo-hydrolase [Candidatus Nitrosopolaris sp.]|nr:M20/M25/M40 family metallo-hydrolase [Candidatus Nitrosopolaris sp.]
MRGLISDLQILIRQPSISAKKQGLAECANLVSQIMVKAGIKSEVLYLCHHDSIRNQEAIPPIVYGEAKSKMNPGSKTLLFYNHYDVQPEEPVELWDTDPFSGKVEGNYIYGRGSADDKGELITRIKAVEYFLKKTGDVPCNIKFIVEGEEEIGSVNLEKYLSKYRQKLAADGVIWEFGYVDEKNKPLISLGMKGLLYVELVAKGPSQDVHSSLAVLIENPAWRLVQALNSIRSKDGRILIKDWYEEIREFTSEELDSISREPFDAQEFKKQHAVDKFVNDAQEIEVRKALVGMPTCNISGLVAGYVGQGAKTVLPSTAKAKIDFRLVPDMDPTRQFQRLITHLENHGFHPDIDIKLIHGEWASRTPINQPFVKLVEDSAKETFGTEPVISVSSSGTGPMHSFVKLLGAPCVSVGSTFIYARIHSPNEFARVDLLNKATKCIAAIIEKFGKH